MSTLGLKWEGYTERGVWATKSNTSPELVYQLVAPNFTDLVWKIEVQKSLWNTDKYEQVVISSDQSTMEMSVQETKEIDIPASFSKVETDGN